MPQDDPKEQEQREIDFAVSTQKSQESILCKRCMCSKNYALVS